MKRNSFTPLQINQSIQNIFKNYIFKYSKRKFVTGFTLAELLIGAVIIAILAAIMYPQFETFHIRAKMSELYNTVTIIEDVEDPYYFKHGSYAAEDVEPPENDLPYTTTQAYIDRFKDILNIYVPGMDSTFVYGVYHDPAKIYVRVRAHSADPPTGWGTLCYKIIEGNNKGKWRVYEGHPWAKYLSTKETTPRI